MKEEIFYTSIYLSFLLLGLGGIYRIEYFGQISSFAVSLWSIMNIYNLWRMGI